MNQWLVPGVYLQDGSSTGFNCFWHGTFYFADGSFTVVSTILGQNPFTDGSKTSFVSLYCSLIYLPCLYLVATDFGFLHADIVSCQMYGPISSRAIHNVTFRMVRWVHIAGIAMRGLDWAGETELQGREPTV